MTDETLPAVATPSLIEQAFGGVMSWAPDFERQVMSLMDMVDRLPDDPDILGPGCAALDFVIHRLGQVREAAGLKAYRGLPDETYKWRGETRTRKGAHTSEEKRMLVDPKSIGGGWREINFRKAIDSVLRKMLGEPLSVMTVVNTETGEAMATVPEVVDAIGEIVGFNQLKSNGEKGTGLAKWGFDRGDFAGRFEQARHNVVVAYRMQSTNQPDEGQPTGEQT